MVSDVEIIKLTGSHRAWDDDNESHPPAFGGNHIKTRSNQGGLNEKFY